MQPSTKVSGAPRRMAAQCITIMSIVAGMVVGWPWAIIARLSPHTATSTPAISAQRAEV